ncbi:MAG TPA: cytochrome c biogenesis protein CcdA [Candidatus Caldiarchaeum subterraneum]|uniref:Cytochrome c biogenesis protein CcdA n=1 Tax=Caldiarchaeum subterraneum TaxID=311458 RepID=A0A832ZWH1_CALS0|nr:cytochrome c biogenesis protein CcdA [Candidatus Caldarchaeum subterraneum]
MTADQIWVVAAFSATAGVLALISPCGYALLPGYVAYLLGEKTDVRNAALLGFMAVLGLLTVYTVVGILTGLAGSIIVRYIPWFPYIAAAVVITLGVLMLLNINIPFIGLSANPATRFGLSGKVGFYIFGIGYGLGAQACTLPIFLTIVIFAVTLANPLSSMLIFLAYTTGVAAPLITTTILVSLAKTTTINKFKALAPKLHKISGIFLIIVGIYLILLGMGVLYIYGTDIIFLPK